MMKVSSICSDRLLKTGCYFLVLLLFSCDFSPATKKTDSQAERMSPTTYLSGLQMPNWVENEIIWEINLTEQYTMDSVMEDLSYLRRIGSKCLLIRNLQESDFDTIINVGRRKVLYDLNQPDSTVGSLSMFKDLVFSAHQKGLKVIAEWNFIWLYKDAIEEGNLDFVNWDDEHYKLEDSDLNNEIIKNKILNFYNQFGVDGLHFSGTMDRDNRFWMDLRNKIGNTGDIVLIGETSDEESLDEIFNLIENRVPELDNINIDYINKRSILNSDSDLPDLLCNHGPAFISWPLNSISKTDSVISDPESWIVAKETISTFSNYGQTAIVSYSGGLISVKRTNEESELLSFCNMADSTILFPLSSGNYRDLYSDTLLNSSVSVGPNEFRIFYSNK